MEHYKNNTTNNENYWVDDHDRSSDTSKSLASVSSEEKKVISKISPSWWKPEELNLVKLAVQANMQSSKKAKEWLPGLVASFRLIGSNRKQSAIYSKYNVLAYRSSSRPLPTKTTPPPPLSADLQQHSRHHCPPPTT
jgi:hypothetical protein